MIRNYDLYDKFKNVPMQNPDGTVDDDNMTAQNYRILAKYAKMQRKKNRFKHVTHVSSISQVPCRSRLDSRPVWSLIMHPHYPMMMMMWWW